MKMTLNTFRYLYYRFVNTPFREIHLSIHPMYKSVEEKLGLPPRPRKPINAYLRFSDQIRPSLTAENPNLKQNGIMKLIAEKWNLLADREKFIKEYHDERLIYVAKLTKYKDTLSEDDKAKINNMKAEKVERKMKLSIMKKCQELSKPKRPTSNFVKYLNEQTDSKVKRTKSEYQEHLRNVGSKWKALSDAEREKYNTSEEMKIYQKAMKEWESEMIDLGHYDVIRKTPI